MIGSQTLSWVKMMLSWASAHQDRTLARLLGQSPTLDVQLHGVFYAIVQVTPGSLSRVKLSVAKDGSVARSCPTFVRIHAQGVLYVLCYKHELLLSVESTAAREEIGIALRPILFGPLNPLNFCLDNVVCEFERLGLCDCAQAGTDPRWHTTC